MTGAELAIAEAVLRLGFRAWQAHKAAKDVDEATLTDAEVLAEINGISIGDADDLINQGAASTAAE